MGRVEEVATEDVRVAVSNHGVTPYELAKRLGWIRTVADTTRVHRTLGLASDGGRKHAGPRQTMSIEMALRICEVCGIDPVDVGA